MEQERANSRICSKQQKATCRSSTDATIPIEPLLRQISNNGFSLSQVEILTTVGAGTFGRVELVKRRGSSNSYYALKKMRILQVINLRQVSHVISERQILSSISSPFIVNLLWTTRDNIHLYLLMEYIPGGELFTHLRNEGRFDENRARFYAAEIVCAFTYLHAENIVYRDLKPENVLINVDGHIKLTDFGFAKRIRDRTWTLCGTPEYLSPEVILNSGHGKAVDWWSLGILIHEMLVGEVPFGGNHVFEVYENIVRGEVNFPFYLSVNATQIIRGLLKRDRTYRLGNMREGAADVKNHQWFSSINWDDVLEKRLIPPIIPYVMHPGDPANFEEYDPEEEIQPHEILNEADVQAQFGDFKFCSDRLFSTSP
ncbi:Oidioi.mRNA.OKI2018_I69.chr2.g5824.t1.cds [Oikopleura dioica]|uniref:Oidioi.mRNA.OKI2018_I69.chr2.g5824.t1.cds n=1 Tax=Oikopleura dioica TaxID=34765 RepID=A0ABN7T530_OIKDI|nr:Oidioi.mRNA.OKI2018_I69.chr2.g5824.t1.cds [Oikopleura dioica]